MSKSITPTFESKNNIKKRKNTFFLLASRIFLVAVLNVLPVAGHAQDVDCTYNLCLEGLMQLPFGVPKGGPACLPYLTAYFALQIWTPYFNPPATAAARNAAFLTSLCPTQIVSNTEITAILGPLPIMP